MPDVPHSGSALRAGGKAAGGATGWQPVVYAGCRQPPRTVCEWELNPDEVHIFIQPPPRMEEARRDLKV